MNKTPGQNGPEDPYFPLIDALGSSDKTVRQNARTQLIGIGLPAVPALTAALTDCNDHARWEAIKALGEIQDPAAAPSLVKAMGDKNVDVRWAAAESLVRFKLSAVTPILIMLVNDFDTVWLREGARYVFRQLKKQGLLDHPAAIVLEALDSPAPEVQAAWSAKYALEEMHIDWGKEIKTQPGEGQKETDIPIGAEVKCADGQTGQIVRIIVNPSTEKVTYLVVKEQNKGRAEYLVSLDKIIQSSPTSVYLLCNHTELEAMMKYRRKQIGPEELAIRPGSKAFATDGEAGKVDELVVDPTEGKITHLILREGRRWDQKEVTITADQIDHIEENAVYLKLDKCAIDFLPSIPLHRRKQKHDQG